MALSYAILGLLLYSEKTFAHLNDAFNNSIKYFLYASQDEILNTITKLNDDGLINIDISPNKVIDNQTYSITQTGKKFFKKWLNSNFSSLEIYTHKDVLLKVFFSGFTTKENTLQMIKKYKKKLISAQLVMTDVPCDIDIYKSKNPDHIKNWDLCAVYGRDYIEMCIVWCNKVIDNLSSRV